LSLGLAFVACAPHRAAQLPPGPARAAASDSTGREALGITVYNQNFGLVRERRKIELGTGKIELAFHDVARELQAETVHIRGDSPEALRVVEQNYRYDLLTPETLLKKYVGQQIKVIRYNEKLGTDEQKTAEVLAAEKGVVLRIDGELTYDFPGRYVFPSVPANLVEKPTLVWLLASQKPRQSVEVTYLTGGLNWSADYVLVLAADDKSVDLNGWVTLTNESGASFENAELKLVAGDVQRIAPEEPKPQLEAYDMRAQAANQPAFKEEGLFEYHLYTLDRPTTVRDKEKKQVSLLEGHGIQVKKKLVFMGSEQFFRPLRREPLTNQKLSARLEFSNSTANHLGEPLPKGVVRVYKADQGGAQQFVGEDRIDHTPRDEKVEIKLGDAFDVVGDRKQLKYTQLGSCQTQSDWEISLRNHKDSVEHVEVVEPSGGDWEVRASNLPARRKDAHTFIFDADVPARGETKITYSVVVRWC
jgi:hypothetical protein